MSRKFFVDCCIGGATKIRSGDTLSVLGDNSPENMVFLRNGAAIYIQGEGDESPHPKNKVWSREEVRYLAAVISAITGLAVEETEKPNPVFRKGVNIDFRFV